MPRFLRRAAFSALIERPQAAALALLLPASVFLLGSRSDLLPVLGEVLRKTGSAGLLTLSLLPLARAGAGLNFALPLGLSAGFLAALLSLDLGLRGFPAFFAALAFSTPLSVALGLGHGLLLNRFRGRTQLVSLFLGVAFAALLNLLLLVLGFSHAGLVLGDGGSGLRPVLRLGDLGFSALASVLVLPLGGMKLLLAFPLIFAAAAALYCTFEGRAKASKSRARNLLPAAVLSAWIAGIGFIVLIQEAGTVRPSTCLLEALLPAAASLVLGGARFAGAGVRHAVLGTLLFQALLAVVSALFRTAGLADPAGPLGTALAAGFVFLALARRGKAAC